MNIRSLDKWHRTKIGLLIFALVELGLMYGFASLSIDRGNLWYYLLTVIFLIGGVMNLSKLIWKLIRGRQTA
jgi:hypothetical protein